MALKFTVHARAVYRNFAEGGPIWGMDKRGGGAPGGSSMVSCEVLHSRGGENDTRGGECPPLNTALHGVQSFGHRKSGVISIKHSRDNYN